MHPTRRGTAPPGAVSSPGMRVPRTFAFIDLSGFTNYTAAFGDEAAGRLLSAFRTIVRDTASDRGVRIAKWLGDGCMLVAIEQPDAVAFTLEVQNRSAAVCRPLTMRAGIASGTPILFEGDDYIGSAVNMAARLCDVAEPEHVLIPIMNLERLPEGITAEPVPPVRLAGFPGEVEVVSLTGVPSPASPSEVGELWTRAPFI